MTLVSQLTLAFQAIGAEVKKKAVVKILLPTDSSSGLADGTVILRTGFASGNPSVPPSGGGWYAEPQGILSVSGATPTKGKVHWVPFDVGPQGWASSGFNFNVTTGFASGVGVSLIAGIYGSTAGGMPDIASGPLCQGTFDLSGTVASGNKSKTWTGGNFQLQPGKYWIGILYTWATTVPSAGQVSCYANTTYRLPTPTSTAPGTTVRSLCGNVNTFTALPSSATLSISGSTECPAVGIIAA